MLLLVVYYFNAGLMSFSTQLWHGGLAYEWDTSHILANKEHWPWSWEGGTVCLHLSCKTCASPAPAEVITPLNSFFFWHAALVTEGMRLYQSHDEQHPAAESIPQGLLSFNCWMSHSAFLSPHLRFLSKYTRHFQPQSKKREEVLATK